MIALLEWAPPERGKRKKSVTVKEESVLHLRLLLHQYLLHHLLRLHHQLLYH